MPARGLGAENKVAFFRIYSPSFCGFQGVRGRFQNPRPTSVRTKVWLKCNAFRWHRCRAKLVRNRFFVLLNVLREVLQIFLKSPGLQKNQQFPNALVLNAVGRRDKQMSAKERKCPQKSANARVQNSAKDVKNMQTTRFETTRFGAPQKKHRKIAKIKKARIPGNPTKQGLEGGSCSSLRARSTLISELKFIPSLGHAIFPTQHREMAILRRIP